VKLMIVILSDQDVDDVVPKLLDQEFRVTKLASTGGFLRRGNTTLLIGTEENLVDQAMETIREVSVSPYGDLGERVALRRPGRACRLTATWESVSPYGNLGERFPSPYALTANVYSIPIGIRYSHRPRSLGSTRIVFRQYAPTRNDSRWFMSFRAYLASSLKAQGPIALR
jgi:hypothetical protein